MVWSAIYISHKFIQSRSLVLRIVLAAFPSVSVVFVVFNSVKVSVV